MGIKAWKDCGYVIAGISIALSRMWITTVVEWW